jgi:hypothetical protein
VNTYCRCSAKRSDFSLSLLAHFPKGDVDLRVGGDADIGFLLILIGFQIELSCLVSPAI